MPSRLCQKERWLLKHIEHMGNRGNITYKGEATPSNPIETTISLEKERAVKERVSERLMKCFRTWNIDFRREETSNFGLSNVIRP
ncbi:hypothetical protein AVEN_27592-1 [Araneus ventricosus]|uniref:Uncharacterized protein n=1 Tax=Araneus ventricosus TaxID=182803 RepID=A0A4Y2Q773_ARAVE|nr:hypothetical protein AVEN_27592-1 [Araneus ventricosus]